MEDKINYRAFSVQDFLCDEYFQDWIIRPNDEINNFWKNWLEENPGKTAEVREARALLENIAFVELTPSEAKVRESLAKVLVEIDVIENNKLKPLPFISRINRIWRVAASLILVAGAALVIYLYSGAKDNITVHTKYGEIDTLSLPDNSVIVLNSNSKIEYSKKWKRNTPRELWLEGEAFFVIRHIDSDNVIEPNERFLAHVGDATIEVLGTSFNVRQRRGKTEIVLQEGKIKVSFRNNTQPDVEMQPGQILRIDPGQRESLTLKETRPEDYSSWVKKRLVLTSPTLKEIIEYLEDVYGKRIELSDPGMASRRIDGPILLDSLDDALFVLSAVLNVDVIKSNDKIILRPK